MLNGVITLIPTLKQQSRQFQFKAYDCENYACNASRTFCSREVLKGFKDPHDAFKRAKEAYKAMRDIQQNALD
jgi:hypothetical protein